MMRTLPLILIFAFSFFISELSAQTIAGGEIYYELLSPKKYKVTAHIYRMCDKTALNNLAGNVYGGSTIVAMNFQRIAISKINDTCGNPCNKQNAVSNPGYEKHTYTDTVDFNYAPYDVFVSNNICTVNFGIRKPGRPSNLSTHSSGYFYIDASTNICLSNITKNTSPQFSMDPKFQAACNWPLTYSPGPLDTTDNDSFSFMLTDVQSDYNTNLTYNSPFTAQIPMTPFCLPPGVVNCLGLPNAKPPRGFYMDPFTGMTIFTPSNCTEVGTIKYRVNEFRYNPNYRSYEWLGYVTREMVVQVIKLIDNTPPLIPTTNSMALCEGNKVCFTISTTDAKTSSQTKADTTTLFWDQGINNATFITIDPTARERQGEFCWQTKKKTGRVEANYFTVAVYDKKCNVDIASKTFKVTVVPKPNYTYTNATGKCGLVKWTNNVYDSFYNIYGITCLTTIKSAQSLKVLYSGTGLNDSAVIHENGKLIIEHTIKYYNGYNYNCALFAMDTLTVNGALELPDVNNNKDSLICKNDVATFSFKPSLVKNLKTFNWLINDSLINQTDSILSFPVSKDSRVKLRIENTGGCIADRLLNYNLKKHDAISSVDKSFCIGDLATTDANVFGLKMPLTLQWKLNGVDTSTISNMLKFVITKDTKVSLSLKDADNCPYTDSVLYKIKSTVRFSLNYNAAVCKDSLTTIEATNVMGTKPFVYKWQIDGKDTLFNDVFLTLKISKSTMVRLMIKDKNDCVYNDSTYKDSVFIKPVNTPEVKLKHDIIICANSNVNIIPSISNRPSKINYQWSFNKAIIGIDSFLNRKITIPQLIRLKVSNQLNCATEDTVNISLFPVQTLNIANKTNYHPSSFIIVGTIKPYQSYQWFNGKTTALDSFQASDLGPPGKYKIWCKTTDANGCIYNDTVEIFTNQFLSVDRQNLSDIKIYPNPVNSILITETLEKSEMELFSMDGRLLVVQVLEAGINQVNFSLFAKGIYFIRLSANGVSAIYKITKE